MKFIIEKRNYIILFVIVLLFLFILFYPKRKPFVKTYKKHGVITVMIYDKTNYDKIDKKIKNIKGKSENFDGIDASLYDMEGAYIVKGIVSLFKKEGIKRYLINENGNITAGKNYDNGKYLVSINDPANGDIIDTLNIEDESMATLNYEGNYDSVIVLHKDNAFSELLVNYLSDKDFDEAREICKKYSCEVYFLKDDESFMTDGFKKIIN